jgi:hypothetical protein
MRRTILIGAMLSAALTTGVGAQTPQTSKGSNEPTSATDVKMTGCLRSGDGARDTKGSDAAAPVTAGASRPRYVLTDATTPGGTQAATSYQLSGGNQDDLQKYVNSKVEVLATLSTSSNASPPPPSTGATSGSTGTAGATGSGATATRETGTTSTMPGLRVRSMRQVAGTCMP